MSSEETVKILRLILVSPSDVKLERDAVPAVIEDVNRITGRELGVRIELWRWEIDSYPGFHVEGPQGLIDELMGIESSAIVVAIFWKRFGTPVSDAQGGTEHEIRKALSAFRKTGSPQIMIYFCQRPYTPSLGEIDQWKAVLNFRNWVEAEKGLSWPFTDASDFASQFRNHLHTFLKGRFAERKNVGGKREKVLLQPPSFAVQTIRNDLVAELERLCQEHSILAIEGLPGSGKTFLVSQFSEHAQKTQLYSSIYWYSPQHGETLDEGLLQFGSEFSLSASSPQAQAMELISEIQRKRSVLVIDDYHVVDQFSYSALLNAAARFGRPAVLFLISRTYVDAARILPIIEHFEVSGFSTSEINLSLESRGLDLSAEHIELLKERTDGLPQAISLFAVLVGHFGRDPNDLLADEMDSDTRLRHWFDEIIDLVTEEQRELLKALSLYEIPFNNEVVRDICKHIGIKDYRDAFETLQKRYLVQRQSSHQWRVHHLIAMFSSENIPEEQRRNLLTAFADHCIKGISTPEGELLSESELVAAARAVRFFQRAKKFADSGVLLERMAACSKRRGLYDLYLAAAEVELNENDMRDSWTDYHCGHCCLITGRIQRAFEVIEPLVYRIGNSEPVKRIAVVRLYADLLRAAGR